MLLLFIQICILVELFSLCGALLCGVTVLAPTVTFCEVLDHALLVILELHWCVLLIEKDLTNVHEDLFNGQDSRQKEGKREEFRVIEGCDTHSEVAVEEAERVRLSDHGLFVVLLVLVVLSDDNLSGCFSEVSVEIDDAYGVRDDRELAFREVEAVVVEFDEAWAPHRDEPDTEPDHDPESEHEHGSD